MYYLNKKLIGNENVYKYFGITPKDNYKYYEFVFS